MAYATLEDLGIFGWEEIARRAVDESPSEIVSGALIEALIKGDPPPVGATAAEIAAGNKAIAERLQPALDQTADEMDSYLCKQYDVRSLRRINPASLKKPNLILARHDLYDNGGRAGPSDSGIRYEKDQIIRWLEQISTGALCLPDMPDDPALPDPHDLRLRQRPIYRVS